MDDDALPAPKLAGLGMAAAGGLFAALVAAGIVVHGAQARRVAEGAPAARLAAMQAFFAAAAGPGALGCGIVGEGTALVAAYDCAEAQDAAGRALWVALRLQGEDSTEWLLLRRDPGGTLRRARFESGGLLIPRAGPRVLELTPVGAERACAGPLRLVAVDERIDCDVPAR